MKGREMWKKIVLGIIIGTVVLTVGAGGIYAYQKNSNTRNDVIAEKSKGYGKNNNFAISNCADSEKNDTEQYCLQNEECKQWSSSNRNCLSKDYECENCLNQNQNMENNCYRYNNGGTGDQNQNTYCFRNNNRNKINNQDCQINSYNGKKSNASGNGSEKNK
jgi:hypothetical protein